MEECSFRIVDGRQKRPTPRSCATSSPSNLSVSPLSLLRGFGSWLAAQPVSVLALVHDLLGDRVADLLRPGSAFPVGHLRDGPGRPGDEKESAGDGSSVGATMGDVVVLCAHCGAPLTGLRSDARYCSRACQQAAYRERRVMASRPLDRLESDSRAVGEAVA